MGKPTTPAMGLPFASVSFLSEAAIDSTAASVTVVQGIGGMCIRVYMLWLVLGAAANLTFKDEATGFSGALPMLANGSIFMPFSLAPWFTCTPGASFVLAQSGSVQLSGRVYYVQEMAQ